jgi:hypothetical protein
MQGTKNKTKITYLTLSHVIAQTQDLRNYEYDAEIPTIKEWASENG